MESKSCGERFMQCPIYIQGELAIEHGSVP
jgi:hypothetical protein